MSEIYSALRVTQALKLLPSLGLAPGFAFDLTTVDEAGNNWDFNDPVMLEKALNRVEDEEPYCLLDYPACTPYCALQALSAV